MFKHRTFVDDSTLTAAAEHYRDYQVAPLSYGTVRDFCDSFDHLQPLATANGDLKDLQRPWMLKAVLSCVGRQSARLLEIGAGEPLVADLLRRLGHEVWVVDPYDGSGNGPRDFERFRRAYPRLTFVRDRFTESTPGLDPASFDCIYSISVLEHVTTMDLSRLMMGMSRFLKPDGLSLHAVDYIHRGRGAEDHSAALRLMAADLGASAKSLDRMLATMSADTDTYYLSAESHNRWRDKLPYEEFPMRICVSVQFRTPASSISAPSQNPRCVPTS